MVSLSREKEKCLPNGRISKRGVAFVRARVEQGGNAGDDAARLKVAFVRARVEQDADLHAGTGVGPVAFVRARVEQASGQCGKLGPNVAGRRRPGRVQKSMEEVTRSKRGPKLTPVSA